MLIRNLLKTWLFALTLLALAACGGGTQLAEGGIGGTGISMGPITGFGSIIQNGVRYDVSQASFTRDGQTATGQAAYRVGEVVTIHGNINANGTTGSATTVEFSPRLQGVVTSASTDNRTIQVLGQTVRIDGLTILHGFALLADLKGGNVVQVSGTTDANGLLAASSLTLLQAAFTAGVSSQLLEGRASQVDSTRQTLLLNGVTVNYSNATLTGFAASQPVGGQYLRVRSKRNLQSNALVASEVSLREEYQAYAAGTELELKGLVTEFFDAANFSVNGQPVITTSNTEFENGSSADLRLNASVEVDGTVNPAGVLVADEVSIQQASSGDTRELEGGVVSLDAARQELVLLGNTIVVDGNTILLEEINDEKTSIRFADLRLDDWLEVKARPLANGKLLALRIDRETAGGGDEVEIKGMVSQLSRAAGTLVVQGVDVSTTGQTDYEMDDEHVSQATFFAAIVPGQTHIKAEGIMLDSQWVQASKLEMDTGDD